jgi:hypothetical protein
VTALPYGVTEEGIRGSWREFFGGEVEGHRYGRFHIFIVGRFLWKEDESVGSERFL